MLGWGIVGCGDITEKRGAPAILTTPGARLVGLQSRTPERAAELARRFGAGLATGSREELLAHPDVAAVYVATEHHRHPEDAVAAAEAGRHVLCEKPLALTAADGRRIVDACRANGVALQVAYYRRYYPKIRRMRELLDAGAIGKPASAAIHLSGRVGEETIAAGAWRLDPDRGGGGALVDTGSHRLDLLCYLLGPPARVLALADCADPRLRVPDRETLLIETMGGVHVTSCHGMRTLSPDRLEIWGCEGMLDASPVDGPLLRLSGAAGERTWELPRDANVHAPLFADFTARVAAGAPPLYSGVDGFWPTAIIEAAYRSARDERWVRIDTL